VPIRRLFAPPWQPQRLPRHFVCRNRHCRTGQHFGQRQQYLNLKKWFAANLFSVFVLKIQKKGWPQGFKSQALELEWLFALPPVKGEAGRGSVLFLNH
jgi:hypothetical protein